MRERLMNKAIPVLEFFGKSEFMEMEGSINEMYYSKSFQWLPTDFTVDAEGKVKLESYINNLHPVEHKAMYPVLEVILTLFIPKFEDVLTDMRAYPNKAKRRVPFPIKVPEFSPPTQPQRYDLRTGQNLQVIIKLANIELTSENPKCTGGSWHVEGMANENIAASRIHYYHSENIAESWLNFRIYVKEPYYEQDDNNGCTEKPLYGIVTREDRCIAFPDIYQHQVKPFKLQDASNPGTRKILTTILSTTHVPPQQKEWVPPRTNLMEDAMRKLPLELVDQIDKLVD
ncbi:hypothetical protein BGZ59_002490 [Podila verticillata]|nr:hypothetical protein BGZ59_002490 [Podila verticillata]